MEREINRSIEEMKEPYVLAKQNDWKGFTKFFSAHKALLTEQIDVNGNTPLHVAAFCGIPQVFEKLLEMHDSSDARQSALMRKNDIGNTPLHDVAYVGDVQMADIILKYDKPKERDVAVGDHYYDDHPQPWHHKSLLCIQNELGETPVFRAVSLGRTKLLKYFVTKHGVDMGEHERRTSNKMSILHVSVISQYFDTATWLLKQKEALADETEDNGMTAFQLLARMPSSFKSQSRMGTSKSLIYSLLPHYYHKYNDIYNDDDTNKGGDLESVQRDTKQPNSYKPPAFSRMWYNIWCVLAKGWKEIDNIWREKELNKLAEELAEVLAKNDYSWTKSSKAADRTVSIGVACQPVINGAEEEHNQASKSKGKQKVQEDFDHVYGKKTIIYAPLFMAASAGIKEIVETIIRVHPQAIDHVSEDEQNILYMAVKNRQREIFKIIKKCGMANRLAAKIDADGNTVLHYAAHFGGGSAAAPGYAPALQLQEALRWFQRMKERIPYHYTLQRNFKQNLTAEELSEVEHAGLLQNAQKWMKETAQSCSAVAVLVATVVFAAAYTIPGGINEHGLPLFIHSPLFLLFTIMDVVSLASSLASVVMFLSIVTSPCVMWDFHRSLPQQLMWGFALLFFSIVTAMIAFSATVLLYINLEKNKLATSLTYSAAFFPVSIFALMQFPLFHALKALLWRLPKKIRKIIPQYFLELH